jgi:hypothetical protein
MAASLMLKFIVYFVETTHEPLYLDKWTVEQKRSWTYLQVLFESLFCLTQSLNMTMVRNFEVMVG